MDLSPNLLKLESTGTSEMEFLYMMGCFSNLIKTSLPHQSDLSSCRRYTKHTKAQIVAYEEPGNPFTGQEFRQQLGKQASRVMCVLNERPQEPMQSHAIPSRPWERVSADLFQLNGSNYLVLVDHYRDYRA